MPLDVGCTPRFGWTTIQARIDVGSKPLELRRAFLIVRLHQAQCLAHDELPFFTILPGSRSFGVPVSASAPPGSVSPDR
jgi:hypothetical protein